MFIEISDDEWQQEFKPIKNHIDTNASFNGDMFETYGEELDFVLAQDQNRIWTYIDGDSGDPLIVNGYQLVNRSGYFITEVPWADEDEINVSLVDYDEEDFLEMLTATEGI